MGTLNRRDIVLYDRWRKEAYEATILNESRRRNIHRMFQLSADLEFAFETDLAEFDAKLLQHFFKRVTGVSAKTSTVSYINLKSYIRWCREHGYPTTDAVSEISVDNIDKLKQRMVDTPQRLAEILDVVFPNPSKNQALYLYRSYIWLAFIGVRGERAAYITEENIDFDHMVLVRELPECDLQIYEEARDDLWWACNLTSFIEPKGAGKAPSVRQRSFGSSILRGKVRSGRVDDSHIFNALKPIVYRAFKACEDTQPHLSYNRVWYSGIFYRASIQEELTGEVDFDYWVDEDFQYGDYQLTEDFTERKAKYYIRAKYQDDYQQWKTAFLP